VLVALAGVVWVTWLFAGTSVAPFFLAVAVGLAAVGLGLGASPYLMLPGVTLALVSWDLMRWDAFVAGEGLPLNMTRLARKHYAALALALVPSLLIAIVGQQVRFSIPFGVLIGVVALALLGLDRVWRLVRHRS
jgi:hypothetical protein